MTILFSYSSLQPTSIVLCACGDGLRLRALCLSQCLEHLCHTMGRQGKAGENGWKLPVRNCRCGQRGDARSKMKQS